MEPEKDNFIVWFIGFMALIVIAWLAVGGPNNPRARQGVFINPIIEDYTASGYGPSYLYRGDSLRKAQIELPPPIFDVTKFGDRVTDLTDKIKEVETIRKSPITSRAFVIDGYSGAQAQDVQKEHIRIVASLRNGSLIEVSGFALGSSITNNEAILPNGSYLPIIGTIFDLKPISIVPGEHMIVTTGKSPIGGSFKVNSCSGYLGQFQTYTPEIKKECPRPETDFDLSGLKDSTCRNFLKTLPQCESFVGVVPSDLSATCKQFVENRINYNSCVTAHKNDTDFYRNEWRVFLGKTKELWKQSGEIIRFVDLNKNLIDAVTY